MTIIVNNGTTRSITTIPTLTTDGTIMPTGILDNSGPIGGAFTLVNTGTVNADVQGGQISINTAALNNTGTLLASIGTIAVASTVAVAGYNSGTGVFGTGNLVASGTGSINFDPGPIITDNASITLNGTASVINTGGSGIEGWLSTIGNTGTLNLLGARSFNAGGSLAVNGILNQAGGTLSAVNGVTIGATGLFKGFGAIDPNIPVTVDGTIEASGGNLTLGANSQFSGTGAFRIDAGASLSLRNIQGVYGETIINNGTLNAASPGISGFATTLTVGGLSNPTYSGTGKLRIVGGPDNTSVETLDLEGSVTANVAFDSAFGALFIGNPSGFTGKIAHFANSDTIVLSGISKATQATLTNGVLSVKNASNTILQSLTLDTGTVNYFGATPAIFSVTENQAQTRATITVANALQAACYAAGTRIRTETGEVAVETIKPGDVVAAHFSGLAPVIWVGHRHVDCRRHPDPEKVWPVRVAAHAFGPRLPARDLFLSPDHAIFVDDVLIPIKQLINGVTIKQVPTGSVVYYHVELAQHDVLLAENLPAESYLENGDRSAFDNGGGVTALHPDFAANRWEALGCAPMVLVGAALQAVKTRLDRRAGDVKSTGRQPSPRARRRAA